MLATTGALVVMMRYYKYSRPLFEIFGQKFTHSRFAASQWVCDRQKNDKDRKLARLEGGFLSALFQWVLGVLETRSVCSLWLLDP